MMTKLKYILIIFLIVITMNSCEKDYPKDIPDWLKSRIKLLIKETRGHEGCRYDVCLCIKEYSNGNNIVYLFGLGGTPIAYRVFNYDGIVECYTVGRMGDTCGKITDANNYHFTRMIWEEDD